MSRPTSFSATGKIDLVGHLHFVKRSNLRVRGDHSAITPRMTQVEITAPG